MSLRDDPISHVAGLKNSPWISTTKSLNTALNKFGADGQTVVRIDLSKVGTDIADVSGGFGKRGMANNAAIKDQEVLIRSFVPPDAIQVIR